MTRARRPHIALRVLLVVAGLVVMQTAVSPAPAGANGAPGAFNKLAPANGATGQPYSVALSWSTSVGSSVLYQYCYDTTIATTCDGPWLFTPLTSAIIGSLSPSTTYYWHVRAVNGSGTTYSNASETAFWSFTTGSVPAPGAFGKTGPANGATGQPLSLTLTWGTSSGTPTPYYEYCYDTTNDYACSYWTYAASTSAAVGGLSPSTTYYWHVRAVNSQGTTYSDGSTTAYWQFTTGLLPAPGAFGKTGPANGATGQPLSVTLSWGTSAGLTTPPVGRYFYCYDTTNDSSCSWWTMTTSTSAAVGGLSPNTTYYWHVQAVNASGSTWSDGSGVAFWHFTTRSSSPTPVTVHFRSVGAYDGWVRESAETSSSGGALNSWSTTCRVGDDALDRQFRSILHFNTGSLPNDAVITSAILEIKSWSLVGSNPFHTHGNLTVDIRKRGFNNAIALEFADFAAPASQTGAGVFGTAPAGGWYSATLGAAAYPSVNLRGHTQLRLRFAVEDNDDAGADYLAFLCGNATPLMDRPALVITYYVP